MATQAKFVAEGQDFPLGAILSAIPNATIEVERFIPTDTDVMPYVWVKGAEADDLEATLSGLEDVEAVTIVESIADVHLLRVEWAAGTRGLVGALRETEATLLSMVGKADQWEIEIRVDDPAGVRACQERAEAAGISVTLVELHAIIPLDEEGDYSLTPSQLEAVTLAYEGGYFETPRRCTLEELAEQVDISGQAFGARLQRGVNRLVGETIARDIQDR